MPKASDIRLTLRVRDGLGKDLHNTLSGGMADCVIDYLVGRVWLRLADQDDSIANLMHRTITERKGR